MLWFFLMLSCFKIRGEGPRSFIVSKTGEQKWIKYCNNSKIGPQMRALTHELKYMEKPWNTYLIVFVTI